LYQNQLVATLRRGAGRNVKTSGVVLVFLFHAAAVGVTVTAEPQSPLAETAKIAQQSNPLTPAEVAQRAFPSVVLLTMQDTRGQPVWMGSGFFVARDIVATNFHVIDQAAAGYAKLVGQSAKLNIKGVVGSDPPHDLALIQLEPSLAPPLPVAPKLSVNIGDAVYAIGNPLGLEGTFSPGVVSSVREIGQDHVLQITAPISPGSSGGPVLDQTGTVIGVSFASIANGQNLNFAIPSEYVAALRNQKTELRSFKTLPPSDNQKTLLGRLGGEHPRTGVVGENFTWGNSGEFSFSLHNKLSVDVGKVHGLIIFSNPELEPLDSFWLDYEGIIPAHSAKRMSGEVDGSVRTLSGGFYWWDKAHRTWRKQEHLAKWEVPRNAKTESRQGKVEFRILDFSVE
jgi:S1-C subfamily serine protease